MKKAEEAKVMQHGEGLETPREWINGVDKTPDPPEWVSGNHPQNITLKVSGYSDEQIAYIMRLKDPADDLKTVVSVAMTILAGAALVAYTAFKVGLIAIVL